MGKIPARKKEVSTENQLRKEGDRTNSGEEGEKRLLSLKQSYRLGHRKVGRRIAAEKGNKHTWKGGGG